MTSDAARRMELQAVRSLLRELKELEPLHAKIASLLPTQTPDTVEHWWVKPGMPAPPNPAPDTINTTAWRQLVRLGHRHVRAYRRLQQALRELRLTCAPAVSDAAEQISEDVLELGQVLHILACQEDALACMGKVDDDADFLVRLVRQQHDLPALP